MALISQWAKIPFFSGCITDNLVCCIVETTVNSKDSVLTMRKIAYTRQMVPNGLRRVGYRLVGLNRQSESSEWLNAHHPASRASFNFPVAEIWEEKKYISGKERALLAG